MSKLDAIELRKLNNEYEQKLRKENIKVLTDIVVYLRGSRLTQYQQELVRKDFIDMILEGEQRSEDINKTLGGDYKGICDEIIEMYPKVSLIDKIRNFTSSILACVPIVLLIFIIFEVIDNMSAGTPFYIFNFKAAHVANLILTVVCAHFIIEFICKTSLNNTADAEKKTKKLKQFFFWWVIMMAIIALQVIIGMKLQLIIFSCNIILIIAVSVTMLVLHRFIDRRIEY